MVTNLCVEKVGKVASGSEECQGGGGTVPELWLRGLIWKDKQQTPVPSP